MKTVKLHYVLICYCLVLVVAASLVAGFFHSFYFILSGVALAAYFIVNILTLRCPYCRCFVNLDKLIYAWRHNYHCPHCGHEIIVVTKIDE